MRTERSRDKAGRFSTEPQNRALEIERARKRLAGTVVRNAVARGFPRGVCVFCGDPMAEAHHEDYEKPRDIVWLCSTHHRRVHWGHLAITRDLIVTIPDARIGHKKLTPDQIRTIRASSGSLRKLGARFGVSGAMVAKIRAGKAWRSVA